MAGALSLKSQASRSASTRQKTAIWLIGQPSEKLPQTVLPTLGDVLKTFFYYHKNVKKTVPDSLKSTTEQLMEIWAKARIPVAFMPNIISKMKAEVDEYILLTKNRKRVSASQSSREENFSTHIAELFDIAKPLERVLQVCCFGIR